MFNRRSDKQIDILCAASRYKFISYSQLKRLGIEAHTSNLSALMKDGILEKTRGGLVLLDVAELEGRIAAALN